MKAQASRFLVIILVAVVVLVAVLLWWTGAWRMLINIFFNATSDKIIKLRSECTNWVQANCGYTEPEKTIHGEKLDCTDLNITCQ